MAARSFVAPRTAPDTASLSGTARLVGTVAIPGSKSLSNRALVCAALSTGESMLRGLASGDDTARMVAGLRALGAEIEQLAGDTRDVVMRRGVALADASECSVHTGLAGTTSRFLTALAALRVGRTTIDGDAGLRRRPMGDVIRLIRTLGANVEELGEPNCLPLAVSRGALQLEHDSSTRQALVAQGGVSSQFVSAMMMVAPRLGGLVVSLPRDMVSREYLLMTAEVMRAFGAHVEVSDEQVQVGAVSYEGRRYNVGADWSSASYPFAAVAIVGGEVRVAGLRSDTAQPEAQFVHVLQSMGCAVRSDADGVVVSRDTTQSLRGADVDMGSMSDLVPTLAVIAACAEGPTTIRGVGFIRAKESDRIGDLATQLRAVGTEVHELPDGLRIVPRALHAAVLDSHDDHRLAMSLALLGLRCDGVAVRDPEVVAKSWPDYWAAMAGGLGLEIRDEPHR
ncbi:MAG: 3-phosphoshikimate 1-carboxyvinyltransferase [Actinobacteria bacterium]|nr:3-phosphoshikimate 1-carboxyvinyltransferase [Actinomycetota bacterium]